MYLRKKRIFTEPPIVPVEIDWDNQISRGLRFACCFTAPSGPIDLVQRVKPDVNETTYDNNKGLFQESTNTVAWDRTESKIDVQLGTIAMDFLKSSGSAATTAKLFVTTDNEFQLYRNNSLTDLTFRVGASQITRTYPDIFSTGSYNRISARWDDTNNSRDVTVGDHNENITTSFSVTPGSTDFHILNRADGLRDCEGWTKYLYIWDRYLTQTEVDILHNNPYQLFRATQRRVYFIPSGGAASYTLTADSGTYTISGTDAEIDSGRNLAANSGTYSYSGTSVDLNQGFNLSADSGAYTYSGTDATLTYAPAGAYDLTADSGSYSYSGTNAELDAGFNVSANSGSYSYSGTAVSLVFGYYMAANSGSYSYSGQNVGLDISGVLISASGTYTYAGTTVSFTASGQTWTLQTDDSTTWTSQTNSSDTWTVN